MNLLAKLLIGYKNLLIFTAYYFSVPLLVSTFFTPYKRYSWKKSKRGIHPAEILYVGVSNILAIIIGMILRLVMILIGICGVIGMLVLGLPLAFFITFLDPYSHIFSLPHLLNVRALAYDWHFGYTPTLDPFAEDLYEHILKFPLVDRHDERATISRALFQDNGGHVLLIGEPGSGRHVLLASIAHAIVNTRFLVFDYISFIKDKKQPEEKEGALEELLDEVSRAGNIVLIFDHFEHLLPYSHLLTSYLEKHDFHVIGITNPDSYNTEILPDKSLMKYFEAVTIAQLSKTHVQEALIERAKTSPVKFDSHIIDTLLDASYQLISSESKHQPEAAITLFDEFVSYHEQHKKEHDIDAIFTTFLEHRLHVPFAGITTRDKKKLQNLEHYLEQFVVGQHEAISEISRALKRRRLALSTETKPIGSFLFLGPTGVGKTQTAKALTRIFFEDSKKLLRFDMASYQNQNQIMELVDDLAQKIRETPYGVLLLDEFEKAHKNLINIFLTILDEGYLHDSHHNQVLCNNLIIIATSNAGSEFIREKLQDNVAAPHWGAHSSESQSQAGQGPATISFTQSNLIDYILTNNIFSPELLNRFDAVVAFSPLSHETIQSIIHLKLEALNRKLIKMNNEPLAVTDELVNQITQEASREEFGGREIDRTIKKVVEDPLAEKLLG